MDTITDHLPADEADRIAGILEDRHDGASGVHPTVEARPLAEAVVSLFSQDSLGHWKRVADRWSDCPACWTRSPPSTACPGRRTP